MPKIYTINLEALCLALNVNTLNDLIFEVGLWLNFPNSGMSEYKYYLKELFLIYKNCNCYQPCSLLCILAVDHQCIDQLFRVAIDLLPGSKEKTQRGQIVD